MKEALVTQVDSTHSSRAGRRRISAAHTRGCATCLTGLRSFDDVSCTAGAHRTRPLSRFWCRKPPKAALPMACRLLGPGNRCCVEARMKVLDPERLGWRPLPGLLGRHASSPQSVHALLGYFLRDRGSPTPFPGRDMLANEGFFDWGLARPLEKVIEGPAHFRLLMEIPELYRQSVAIVEPWANVGINPLGESVRASKNIAYLMQQIADAD